MKAFGMKALDPGEVQMALVAGHGPFAWGKDGAAALEHAELMEELCRMAFLTEALDPRVLPLKQSLVRRHYERKHGRNAYYGQ